MSLSNTNLSSNDGKSKVGLPLLSTSTSLSLSRESRYSTLPGRSNVASNADKSNSITPPSPISSDSVQFEGLPSSNPQAETETNDFAKQCDDFFENPEKFIQDINNELHTLEDSFEELHEAALSFMKQSNYYQSLAQHLENEVKSLKNELKDTYEMKEIHIKEMSALVDTITSLQKDRDESISQYNQDILNRQDLDRLRYENEMKDARIRQLESELAAQRMEFEKLKTQYQKTMKQMATGKLLH